MKSTSELSGCPKIFSPPKPLDQLGKSKIKVNTLFQERKIAKLKKLLSE